MTNRQNERFFYTMNDKFIARFSIARFSQELSTEQRTELSQELSQILSQERNQELTRIKRRIPGELF